MKIIDSFLKQVDFDFIKNYIINNNFPLYYQHFLTDDKEESNECSFTHIIYKNHMPHSDLYEHMQPIVNLIEPKALLRIKINCYPKTSKIIYHKPHTDFDFDNKALILYLNNNDGYTIVGDEKVESIENRALIFDGNKKHFSTSCTNARARFNIAINYL